MSKRTIFTTVTPLPAGITRQTVLETLHSHTEMIDLNPLVEERHPIKSPPNASPEEYHCIWYSLTDRVQYLPGGFMSGKVSYNVCFHDLEMGLQTHCYAPLGLNIKGKWTLGGSLPGEPVAPVELGVGVPLQGLYIREDVDMKCNIVMTSFVKKTLKKAHAALVDRLVIKAQIVDASMQNQRLADNTQMLQSQFTGSSRSSTQYSPTNDSHNAIDDGVPGSPGFSQYGPMSPPLQSPGFQDQDNPNFRDRNAYPEALSIRSSSASGAASFSGSQKGRASYQESMNGNANGRVSWQNLNQTRSPSSQQIDPAYQKANPYAHSAQNYPAELPSHSPRMYLESQDPKRMVHEIGSTADMRQSHGPVELE